MTHVFISYSRHDREYARELASYLQAADLEVWYDREVAVGDRWLSVVAQQIDTSAAVVVVMTPDAERSIWVEREIVRAEQHGKEILPLLLRGQPIMRLSDKHYASVVDGQMPRNEFVERLRALARIGNLMAVPSLTYNSEAGGNAAVIDPLPQSVSGATARAREDWGDAPYPERLYGRDEENIQLGQWLVHDSCHLVAVLGIGGVGKTALVASVLRGVSAQFDYVFWRSLYNAPLLTPLLHRCIQFFSDLRRVDIPSDVEDQVAALLGYLQANRCVLVLDNFEAIIQGGDRTGKFRQGYEDYAFLLSQVGQTTHRSCLILTSREKPAKLSQMEGVGARVRSLELRGLSYTAANALLNDKGISGPDKAQSKMVDLYSGNPLALKIVAETIRETCGGDIALFLRQEEPVFGDIHGLIEAQFNRLTQTEQEIMYWLATSREALSLEDIRRRIVRPLPKGEVLASLASLRRRSIVEARGTTFVLQPVVAEYVTARFIDIVRQEVSSGDISLLGRHSIVTVDTKEFVREDQIRLIVQEVLSALLRSMSKRDLEETIKQRISQLRERNRPGFEYAAGNLLNLLIFLGSDLRDKNFSDLTVRHACLYATMLSGANFSGSNLAMSVFAENFDVVLSLAFSHDDQFLAAGTATGEVQLWRTLTRVPFMTYHGHTGRVRSVAFSPDGNLLVSGSDDQTVRLWDVRTGECLKTLQGHAGRVRSVAIDPDGRRIASSGDDHLIRLWDTSTGEMVNAIPGHGSQITSLTYGADGRFLASAGDDSTVRIWNAATWTQAAVLEHDSRILFVAVSSDCTLIASGAEDGGTRIWDVATGRLVHHLEGHESPVRSVAFSSDSKILASAGEDWVVRLWETETGESLGALLGHSNRVYAAAFTSSGYVLASGGEDHTVRLWDVRTRQPLTTLHGHTNWVWTLSYSPDGKLLASGSDDQMIRLWNARTMQMSRRILGHTNRVRSVAFSPDGDILASGSDDRTVRLWSTKTGQLLYTLHGHTDRVRAVAFRVDGKVVASGSDDRTVRMWDIDTGQLLHTLAGHTAWLRSIVFGLGQNYLASGAEDGTIRLWDAIDGRSQRTWLAHNHQTQALACSPDGALLASSGDDQLVKLWDAGSGVLLRTMQGHMGPIRAVAFSPDGTMLASGGDDKTVRFWDISTGSLLKTLHGHTRWIFSVRYSPNGEILASSSEDGTIIFWSIKGGAIINVCPLDRQYERMDITGARGLTDGQMVTLRALGAIDFSDS